MNPECQTDTVCHTSELIILVPVSFTGDASGLSAAPVGAVDKILIFVEC